MLTCFFVFFSIQLVFNFCFNFNSFKTELSDYLIDNTMS